MNRFLASLLLGFCATGFAQEPTVRVTNAWVRSTVPGQQASAAFMTLTASKDTQLVALSTPVAGVAVVHEMRLENQVMHMRAIAGGLALPAGQAVALQPGGLHMMLMDLKTTLSPGTRVALTLVLQDARHAKSQLRIEVPVRASAPVNAADAPR
jgi:hypothetical protein